MTTATKTEKKADNKAAKDAAKDTKADVGVETPAEEGPTITTGVGMQLVNPGTFAFAPIDQALDLPARQQRVLELLEQSKSAEGQLEFIQGELLYEANKNGYWKTWTMEDSTGVKRPYNSFDEFVEERLGLKRRTAYNRIEVYSTYVVKLQIPVETLKGIDLSKALLVTKIVKEDNWPVVFDAIKGMSWTQVNEFAKNMKSANTIQEAVDATLAPKALPSPTDTSAEAPASGATTKDSEGVKTFSLKLSVGQYDNVKAAIGVVKTATGTESDAQALDVIATEYLAANSAGMKKQEVVERMIQNIEATYGVVLKVESVPADWNDGANDQD